MKKIIALLLSLTMLMVGIPAVSAAGDITTVTLLEQIAVTTDNEEAWLGVLYTTTSPGDGQITVTFVNSDTVIPEYQVSIGDEWGEWRNCAFEDCYTQIFDVRAGDSIQVTVATQSAPKVYTPGSIGFTVTFTGTLQEGSGDGGDQGGTDAEEPVDVELELGDNPVKIFAGELTSPAYTWTPAEDGYLTLTMTQAISNHLGKVTDCTDDIAALLAGGSLTLLVNDEVYSEPVAVTAGTPVTVVLQQSRLMSVNSFSWDVIVNLSLSQEQQTVLLGDINLSGSVNVGDLNLLYRYCMGVAELSEEQLVAANLNQDAKVNVADLNTLYRYISCAADLGWEPVKVPVN